MNYEAPVLEVIEVKAEDIIRTSTVQNGGNYNAGDAEAFFG